MTSGNVAFEWQKVLFSHLITVKYYGHLFSIQTSEHWTFCWYALFSFKRTIRNSKVCDEYWIFHFDRNPKIEQTNFAIGHTHKHYALKYSGKKAHEKKKRLNYNYALIDITKLHVSDYSEISPKIGADESKLNNRMEPIWTFPSEGLFIVNRSHRWRFTCETQTILIICAFECFTSKSSYQFHIYFLGCTAQ